MSRIAGGVAGAPDGHDSWMSVPLPEDVDVPDGEVGADPRATITPYRDGPLIVRGDFRLVDQDGQEIDPGRRTVALCRCGRSSIKPFCDGTHKRSGFTAASAPRRPRPASHLAPASSGAPAQQHGTGGEEPQVHQDDGGEADVTEHAEGRPVEGRRPGGEA